MSPAIHMSAEQRDSLPPPRTRGWLKSSLAVVALFLGGGMAWHALANWITPPSEDSAIHRTP
jgi:hypothetical protein